MFCIVQIFYLFLVLFFLLLVQTKGIRAACAKIYYIVRRRDTSLFNAKQVAVCIPFQNKVCVFFCTIYFFVQKKRKKRQHDKKTGYYVSCEEKDKRRETSLLLSFYRAIFLLCKGYQFFGIPSIFSFGEKCVVSCEGYSFRTFFLYA